MNGTIDYAINDFQVRKLIMMNWSSKHVLISKFREVPLMCWKKKRSIEYIKYSCMYGNVETQTVKLYSNIQAFQSPLVCENFVVTCHIGIDASFLATCHKTIISASHQYMYPVPGCWITVDNKRFVWTKVVTYIHIIELLSINHTKWKINTCTVGNDHNYITHYLYWKSQIHWIIN